MPAAVIGVLESTYVMRSRRCDRRDEDPQGAPRREFREREEVLSFVQRREAPGRKWFRQLDDDIAGYRGSEVLDHEDAVVFTADDLGAHDHFGDLPLRTPVQPAGGRRSDRHEQSDAGDEVARVHSVGFPSASSSAPFRS